MEAVTTNKTVEKYPAYKDSGVEWLGEIPEHWDTRRIKFLFRIGRGRVIAQTELREDGIYPVYSSQTQANGVLGYLNTYDFDCKQITWTTDGANAGTIFLREGKHSCTNVCGTLQPLSNQQVIEFITYSLQVAAQFYKRPDTNGAKIMNGEMAEIFVTLPSKEEQTAIARFLDEKTALIDKAIAIKEQQIELLKERRQILIHRAVTRGLNPNVKFKDSGVEWIGEIPEGWQVEKVKNIFKLIIDPAPIRNNYELLSVYTDIGVKPRKELEERGNKASTTDGYWRVKKGDIIVNKLLAWMGAIGVSEYEGVTSPAYDILRSIKPLNEYYYHYLFRTKMCSSELKKHSRGIMEMRLRLYFDKFGIICVPFPPITEQNEIVEYIKNIDYKTIVYSTQKEKEIEKLKEYKTSLINSAVTGKIKVS